MTRYEEAFERCAAENRGALVPFAMLADPTPEACLEIVDALVAAGADALELGLPFSDPAADGPVIQSAHIRALAAGGRAAECFDLLAQLRARHPRLPIGLLTYATLTYSLGVERFYRRCAQVGVDSVLVADVPLRESARFEAASLASGVDMVCIAPPRAQPALLAQVASKARGYVYAVSRVGVTGADSAAGTGTELSQTLAGLREHSNTPILLGFGISQPEHVRAAISAGADGVICGSAIVRLIAGYEELLRQGAEPAAALAAVCEQVGQFFSSLRAATSRVGEQ
ncbi:MAG: tryptophan synthase subunit alpha [Buchananella hordeovulneris]|nr:tryptophan synthase subunit alpha [Buchananella hordeovulneris]